MDDEKGYHIGVSISDLDLLTVGLVIDMWTEKANDGMKYNRVATQEDNSISSDVYFSCRWAK